MRPSARFLLTLSLLGFAACSSDDGSGPDPVVPPSGLTTATTAGSTVATVTWRAVPGASGYILQRAQGATGGTFAQVGGTLADTVYVDAGVAASTTYRYRVASVRDGQQSVFGTESVVTVGAAGPMLAYLSGRVQANRTLFADTLYVLSGFVKVDSGVTLTIQPGTRIVGDTAADRLGSSLWIRRGARIVANGTAAEPIVFTSWYRVMQDEGNAAVQARPGDWGGLVIVGRGIINRAGASILTEGSGAGQAEDYAGGGDNADDSGVLRYVRIEFAGFDVSNGAGQELNALSSYAVGRGTTYEYIQTMSGLDDSFEWWGGAVDGRYLVSYESGDDHFDWSEGYRGRNQFLIALQTQKLTPRPGAGTFASDPRLFEGDGCDPGVSGCTVTATGASQPYSMPVFANFTLVGPGQLGGFPADGNGIVVRRGTGGTFVNGMVLRARGTAINLRDAWTDSLRMRDSLVFDGIVLAENGQRFNNPGTLGDSASMVARIPGIRYANAAAELVTSLNPAGLDWRPPGASPAATGGATAPAARVAGFFANTFENTAYIGAVAPAAATPWYAGWTRYVIR